MAIRFGMTVAEIIGQLTRGFAKMMGRDPDGLEKIKIQQEAVQRFKDMNKVVDLEGSPIDTSKGIMGGRQADKFISQNKTMIDEAIDNTSPGFSGDRKVDAELVAEDLAERMGKVYDDLPTKERLDLYDQAYTGLSKQRFKGMKKPKDDPEDMAQGGRAGFKTGLGKRFLELLKGESKKMFRSKDDVPTSVFSEKTGPITIEDMENIPANELRKIRRTQELGLYDETPEILKAGNLFERFTKKVGDKRVIDYDRAEFILNRKLKGDETLNELLQIEYQTRPGRADGGRIGLKAGMTKRAFLKLMGMTGAGIGALKTGLLGFGKEAAPMVEAAKETVTQAPSYFFDLVAKIKLLGTQRRTPSYRERVNEYQYTGKDGNEYLLTEELDTGDIMIQKDKLGGRNYGDESYEVIEDRTEMVFRKGQADETTKGTPADEYEEYKVEFDQDGTAADATDIDELSKKEIIKEVTGDAPSIKKAGGGIARMLGE